MGFIGSIVLGACLLALVSRSRALRWTLAFICGVPLLLLLFWLGPLFWAPGGPFVPAPPPPHYVTYTAPAVAPPDLVPVGMPAPQLPFLPGLKIDVPVPAAAPPGALDLSGLCVLEVTPSGDPVVPHKCAAQAQDAPQPTAIPAPDKTFAQLLQELTPAERTDTPAEKALQA